MPRPPPVTRATRPASSSATGHLAPRLAGVGAQGGGQAEQPLTAEGAQPLRLAALEGVGRAARELPLQVLPVDGGRSAVRAGRVAAVQPRLDAQHVDAELVDLLVELGADQL